MKLKDFLSKLKKDGKINSAEFDSAIETAPDWDFPDKAIDPFEASFLTLDRAATEKSVHSKLKREFLDPFDNDFKKILGVIDTFDHFKASEIDKLASTYEKSSAITTYLPDLLNKIKAAPAGDEETKKELKKQKDTVQELLAKIEKINTETAEREKHWQKEAEEKINSYKLNGELEKLSKSIKLASEFEKARDHITKSILGEIKASNNLAIAETDGQTVVQVLDKEGKPRFNGNSAITINQLLEEGFKPFIKANNAGDGNDGNEGSGRQETKRFTVPDGKPQIRQGVRTTVG